MGMNVGQLEGIAFERKYCRKGNHFQDQELIRSKFSETRNTHLKFDQMQRISVEGKVGEKFLLMLTMIQKEI